MIAWACVSEHECLSMSDGPGAGKCTLSVYDTSELPVTFIRWACSSIHYCGEGSADCDLQLGPCTSLHCLSACHVASTSEHMICHDGTHGKLLAINGWGANWANWELAPPTEDHWAHWEWHHWDGQHTMALWLVSVAICAWQAIAT